MKQDDKELLLKDLCARLPYGVKAEKYTIRMDGEFVPLANIEVVTAKDIISLDDCPGYTIKPYLFPLSSMTEEQCYKLASIHSDFQDCWKYIKTPIPLSICNFEQIEWFHRNHLDYRGLIPMGLANDATELNIYQKLL